MILEFSVANFRSIKEKQTFSLVAEASKSKRESNSFEVESSKNLRLLKSAVMYGANASGKSNFILSFLWFRNFIIYSGQFTNQQPIIWYDPFLFDTQTNSEATDFQCTFIAGNIKYEYIVSFKQYRVVQEELNFFPKSVRKNLFKRDTETEDNLSDNAIFNLDVLKMDSDPNLISPLKVFKNQTILSRFGRDIPHSQLTPIFSYFSKWYVWNSFDSGRTNAVINNVIENVIDLRGDEFLKRLERLIKAADTKVSGLVLKEKELPEGPAPARRTVYSTNALSRLYGMHAVYDNGKNASFHELPFSEESSGTRVLFALGATILDVIDNGGAIIFDELDNSLHPQISRFLVQIFNNEQYNTKNAQLIFSSHEVSLLDKDVFRSDQIWFAEKNERGETEIYSAQDFENVREDIPFEKWYLAGKFGAIPMTKDIDFIFSDAKKASNL